jgi:tetratricopeptide (TPR) repeat protein
VGEPEKGVAYLKEARIADPFFEPSWYWSALGAAHFNARQYDEAIAALSRSQIKGWRQALLAACYALSGRDAEARRETAEALRHAPGFSIKSMLAKRSLKRPEDREHLIEGLRKAGLPD